MKRLAFWMAAALPALGQTPVARVYLAGAPNPMVVGQSATLNAVARDAAGNPVLNAPLTWSSSNTNVLTINSMGCCFRAVGLGNATITVASGNVRASISVATVPLKIEVDPPSANLLTGARQRFTARALDAERNPIPNANFTWRVLSPNGGTAPGALAVGADGMLTAALEGRYTVEATANGVRGFAPLQIDLRSDYRLTRVFSNDAIPGQQRYIVPAGAPLFHESGRFALVAQLNGWAQQALLFENGQFHPLLASGETDWGFNRLRAGMTINGINSRGETLINTGSSLVLATREEAVNLLNSPVWIGTAQINGFVNGRRGLNEAGEVVFGSNSVQFPGVTGTFAGVFKMTGRRVTLLWTSAEPLEGLAGNITISSQGLDGGVGVYFVAQAGTRLGLYRISGAGPPVRLAGTGDALDGSQISTFDTAAIGNENGDIAITARLADNRTRVLRFRPGAEREVLPETVNTFLSNVNSAGAVLYRRTSGPQQGLYLWEGGETTHPLLLSGGTAPDGANVTGFGQAGISDSGEVFVQVHTNLGANQFMKLEGPVLLKPGDTLDLAVPPFLNTNSLVRGSALRLQTAQSLVEVRPTGLEPVVTVLDPLPDGTAWSGGLSRYFDTDQGIYFPGGPRVYRRTASGYEVAAEPLGNITAFAVNRQGQMAISSPQTGLLYFHDGQTLTRIVDGSTPAPSGGFFTGFSALAVDERGRILALANTTETAPGAALRLFLYDGGVWRVVLTPLEARFRSGVVATVNNIRAAGTRFYAQVTARAGEGYIISMQDGDWQVEFGADDSPPASPAILAGGIGPFDVNANGDLLIRASVNGRNYILLKSGARVRTVVTNFQPWEGSYVSLGPSNFILQDDGTVYVASFDQLGRYLILRADPL